MSDIVGRLRAKVQRFPAQGGGTIGIGADGKTTSSSYITDDGYRLANPDGPEAATLIEQLEAEIARLARRVLLLANHRQSCTCEECCRLRPIARAALADTPESKT